MKVMGRCVERLVLEYQRRVESKSVDEKKDGCNRISFLVGLVLCFVWWHIRCVFTVLYYL